MKRIIFLLLAAVIVAACGNPAGHNTKGGANTPQSQKQQEKKDHNMQKENMKALNGDIGTAAENTDLANATFLSNEFEHNGKKMQIKLVFNKEKNICTHFIDRNMLPHTHYPSAEYAITNSTLTLNHKKHSTAYTSITRELLLEAALKHEKEATEKKGLEFTKEFEQKIKDTLVKVPENYITTLRNTYREYQKYIEFTGTISSDKKTVTFKTLTTMDFLNENVEIPIITVKDIVFTRQN